jgi:YidC/Oxa1 family membrane protein insertase
MERNSLIRTIAIALLLLGGYWFFFKRGKTEAVALPAETYVDAPDFRPDPVVDGPQVGGNNDESPITESRCNLVGNRFTAELSSRGASVKHLLLTDDKYHDDKSKDAAHRADLSTTPDHERWRSLRTLFRGEGGTDQFAYDRFPYVLASQSEKECVFTYTSELVSVRKVIRVSDRPFELEIETSIKNLSATSRKHRFSISTHAFRSNEEVKGNWGRVSPFLTELTCASSKEIVRKQKAEFNEGWFNMPAADRYAAVSNYYFGQALIPNEEDKSAITCKTLADPLRRINGDAGLALDADQAVTVYTAALQYPVRELAPRATTTYKQTAFFGPKERDVLRGVGGGSAGLGDLINLGFFSPVAKFLVAFLVFLHNQVTNNWGLAVILMTVCLRICLFPLALPQIKQSLLMRKLRPEIDAINKKFKDDAQAKGLATMELHKKHGVNLAMGCLPQLVQMPVWWAMYTTLQTAVEMYHTKFLWFADLSSADKFYILPIVLGGLGFLQARIMPQQPGQDPQQQKMMMYLMPGIFTVMMLFLPAALGVYMTTNSLLGITQQLLVERLAKRAEENEQKKA